MFEPKGICPIIAAPFKESGELDFEDLRNLIQVMAGGGCHGATLFGIAGEYYKLIDRERYSMAETVIEECKKNNIPSIVSVTDDYYEELFEYLYGNISKHFMPS